MSLANLVIRSIPVNYGDNTINIHGVSANDIAGIIASQFDSLERCFDIAERGGVKNLSDLTKLDVSKFGMELLAQAPDFIAHVIAYAAHEPQHAHKVLLIDAPTQLRMLKAVAELTFHDAAGFQEFLGNVAAVLRVARSAAPRVNNLVASESLDGGSASAMQ